LKEGKGEMVKIDTFEVMRGYFPLLDSIKDRELAKKVADIWYETWQESKWKDIGDACFGPEYPGKTLIDHINVVAQSSLAMAEIRQKIFDERVDFDVLIAGALLHDVSKALEFEPTDGKPIATNYRKLFQHGLIGAHKALNKGLSDELVHLIIAHTNKSRLIPRTPEALIIYCMDLADADSHKLKIGLPLTLSEWK
jgi:putative nucleotidyltransferase with HDIG domain